MDHLVSLAVSVAVASFAAVLALIAAPAWAAEQVVLAMLRTTDPRRTAVDRVP